VPTSAGKSRRQLALVACIIALVLTRTSQRMMRNPPGSPAPAVPPSVGDEGKD